MTPAHLKFGIIETNPDLIDITICSAANGFPFLAFECNRAELIAKLQECPVTALDQLSLNIQVPVTALDQLSLNIQVPVVPEKLLDASIFA